MDSLRPSDIARLRLLSHALVKAPDGYPVARLGGAVADPAGVVGWMGAMQGQDLRSVPWSIGARLGAQTRKGTRLKNGAATADTPHAETIREAFNNGSLVRTWTMRGTLHTVAAADVRSFQALTSERMLRAARTRHTGLGIGPEDVEAARVAVVELLSGGGRASRAEVLAAIRGAGQDTAGQRGYHLIFSLSVTGTLVQGPMSLTVNEQDFVLQDEWLPSIPAPDAAQALVSILRRYIASRAPVTIRDFAWWIGLPLGLARQALSVLGSSVVEHDGGLLLPADVSAWLRGRGPGPLPGARAWHLLAGFDEYLLGYQDRSAVLDPEHFTRVVPGGNGIFRKIYLNGGQVQGTWQHRPAEGVLLEPFTGEPFEAMSAAAPREAARAFEVFTG